MSLQLDYVEFPALQHCTEDGLLASGGDLSASTLLSAYIQGIFPWYSQGQPILWWSPDPRMVLFPKEVKISRSMRKLLRQAKFKITANRDFEAVINSCAKYRINQASFQADREDTWITPEMENAYIKLHELGFAHSIEVWQHDDLVGGLYGLIIGKVFFGESMFSKVSNASKAGFITLCKFLEAQQFELIDCQVRNNHLVSLGAREIARRDFVNSLNKQDFGIVDSKFGKNFEHFLDNGVIY